MASAKGFGRGLGKGIGKVAAYAVTGLVVGAEGLGDIGAGLVEGTSESYTLTSAQLDVRLAERKVRLAALQQKLAADAVRALEAAQHSAPLTPVSA